MSCYHAVLAVEDGRHHSKHEQHRPIESRQVIAILSMHLLKVELAQEQRGVKVEPRLPQLPEVASPRHNRVLKVVEL
jgi:hypothetical protein